MARISKGQLIKLQKRYRTDGSIAALFGISRQAVHRMRVRYHVPPVADPMQVRNDEIARQYARGISGPRLSRQFRMSLSQIYRIVARKGLSHSSLRSSTMRDENRSTHHQQEVHR